MTDATRYWALNNDLHPLVTKPSHLAVVEVYLATAYDAVVQRVTELEAALGQRGMRDVAFKLSEEAQRKMDELEAKLAQAEARAAKAEGIIANLESGKDRIL